MQEPSRSTRATEKHTCQSTVETNNREGDILTEIELPYQDLFHTHRRTPQEALPLCSD